MQYVTTYTKKKLTKVTLFHTYHNSLKNKIHKIKRNKKLKLHNTQNTKNGVLKTSCDCNQFYIGDNHWTFV